MKVRVADSAGFCMGVRNAMDAVLEAAHGNPVTYTLGPLIHNPQALKMLESRNIYVVNEIEESLSGKKVVIRAHGTTIGNQKRLKEIKYKEEEFFTVGFNKGILIIQPGDSVLKDIPIEADQALNYGRYITVTRVQSGHPASADGIFIASGPKIPANRRIAPLYLIDILPSILRINLQQPPFHTCEQLQ